MPPRRSTRKKTAAKKPVRKSRRRRVVASSSDDEDVNDQELSPNPQDSGEETVKDTEITVAEEETVTATAAAVCPETVTVSDNGDAIREDTVTNLGEETVLRSFLDSEGIARLGEILNNVLGQNSSLISVDSEDEKAEDGRIGVSESGNGDKEGDLVEDETTITKNEKDEGAGDIGSGFGNGGGNDAKIGRVSGFENEEGNDVKRGGESGFENEGGNDVQIGEEQVGDLSKVQEGGNDVRESAGDDEERGGNEEREGAEDEEEEENAVAEPLAQAESSSGVKAGGNEERDNADNGYKQDDAVMESLVHAEHSLQDKEDDDEEGENIDDGDEGGNTAMESNRNEDGLQGVSEAGEEDEEESSDDGEDGDDSDDNQQTESPEHVEGKIEDQTKRDEVETYSNDVEGGEGNLDSEEVRTVYVKGLTKSWNVEKLGETCKKFGEIQDVSLPRKFGAKHRDFGFIAFTSRESALSCVEGINNGQFGEGAKVKAELAKPKSSGGKKIRGSKDCVRSKVATTMGERIEQTNSRSEVKGKSVVEQALSESKIGKGRQNKNRASRSSDQDVIPRKRDSKRKNSHQEASDQGKRNKISEHDKRQSDKSRGNAQDKRDNRSSRRKLQYRQRTNHGSEYNGFGRIASAGSYQNPLRTAVSGTKRHRLDLAPHAGYIEPTTKKQARHIGEFIDPLHGRQERVHATYHYPASNNKDLHLAEHPMPILAIESLPHAGYLESQGSAAYIHSLMRNGGYNSQGRRGYVCGEGSTAAPSYASKYSSHPGYQVCPYPSILSLVPYLHNARPLLVDTAAVVAQVVFLSSWLVLAIVVTMEHTFPNKDTIKHVASLKQIMVP
ncbi:hypothetical protein Tsubulata_024670 [Turnera subulata]|uniref:RRM domain-containing protein n=1 Tax=Turnera subulata TaxID=218843 RepID=A0A9Q0JJL0_9ROSI|nr:hypothetical protein Tsubulata_024670 [Turnera subulata]